MKHIEHGSEKDVYEEYPLKIERPDYLLSERKRLNKRMKDLEKVPLRMDGAIFALICGAGVFLTVFVTKLVDLLTK